MAIDPPSTVEYLCIPDLLKTWPWPKEVNPLRKQVGAEGVAWLHSLRPFNSKSQYAFDKCNLELFAALMLPSAPRDHLRVGLDLLYLFFVIDEYTDVQPAPVVRKMMNECRHILLHPHESTRQDGEGVLANMIRQFWDRALAIATPQGAKHFISSFVTYLESVVAEAEARDRGTILSLDTYLDIRRIGIGAHPCYAIFDLTLKLPDEIIYSPDMVELTRIGCELVAIDNDILSYNREQASGVGHFNSVTVVMHTLGLHRDGAIEWLAQRSARLEEQYLALFARLSSRSWSHVDVDDELRLYLHHMGNGRRSVWAWSFESGRYFGERGSQIARSGRVPLIPRRASVPTTKREDDGAVDVLLIEEELARLECVPPET